MKKVAISVAVLSFLAVTFVRLAAAQTANFNGTWETSIKRSDGTINEKMTLQQDGAKLTGKIQIAGGEELPLTGNISGESGNVARIEVMRDAKVLYRIQATLHENNMGGTIRISGGGAVCTGNCGDKQPAAGAPITTARDERFLSFIWGARRSK